MSIYKQVLRESTEWSETIDDVTFNLSTSDVGISIDRIEVDPDVRGRGNAKPALQKLLDKLKSKKMDIYTNVLPDSNSDEDYSKLRHIFGSVGFEPDVIDGEVYRNDLVLKYPY